MISTLRTVTTGSIEIPRPVHGLVAECLDVKLDRRFDVSKGVIVCGVGKRGQAPVSARFAWDTGTCPRARLDMNDAPGALRDYKALAAEFAEQGRHAEAIEACDDGLEAQVASIAAALKKMGVTRGDRVVAYMPNMPETVIAMLH